MRLIDDIMIKVAAVTAVLLMVWAIVFYAAITDEMVDEIDDSLELTAENIITDFLAGGSNPPQETGSNNSYSIKKATASCSGSYPYYKFEDRDIWIDDKDETEPARVLSMVFKDKDNQAYLLEVATPTFDIADLKRTLLLMIAILYALLFLAVLMTAYFAVEKSMQPLYSMLGWMDSFNLRNNNGPFKNETGITEFRQLIEAANNQVKRMTDLYERQNQFVDNAAHEMQTPLAIAMNRIEELQQDPKLDESTLDSLAGIKAPLRRLSRLHRDMLNLSRIENGAYIDRQDINIRDLIAPMAEDFQDIFSEKGLEYSISGNRETTVNMNAALAELLFGNLLRNAWLHTSPGGKIEISWDGREFSVSNSGEAPLDGNIIFERFRHNSKSPNSSGLGLAICRSICTRYGFSIEYSYKKNKHFFTILISL